MCHSATDKSPRLEIERPGGSHSPSSAKVPLSVSQRAPLSTVVAPTPSPARAAQRRGWQIGRILGNSFFMAEAGRLGWELQSHATVLPQCRYARVQ
jgi:hypothetical protein